MKRLSAISAVAVTLLLSATSATAQTSSPNDTTRAEAAEAKPMRWQASLRAIRETSGSHVSLKRGRTTGNVFLAATAPERMRAQITLSTPFNDPVSLQWAVVPGRCGDNMPPIVPVERFPVIQTGAGGRAELNFEFALDLTASEQFHVNIYHGGTSRFDIITCGNLNRSR